MLPQEPTGTGTLSGIPFGAKDIIETRGLATEYGSPIDKGRIGTEDAAIVRALRQRGAVLLGKTRTAAFAHRTPAATRSPHALEHTPGGSSSGSAAAVAAGMVPIALGTQTKGSVLRPASYCGVTGFKASEGARFHEQRFAEHGDRLDELAVLVRNGLLIPVERYDQARRYIDQCRARVAELYKATPVILVPAATGPAPHGLGFTGDARMNAPLTTLGTPAISIPMPVTSGLPLGLQLTVDHGQDARVLRAAEGVYRLLSTGAPECAGGITVLP